MLSMFGEWLICIVFVPNRITVVQSWLQILIPSYLQLSIQVTAAAQSSSTVQIHSNICKIVSSVSKVKSSSILSPNRLWTKLFSTTFITRISSSESSAPTVIFHRSIIAMIKLSKALILTRLVEIDLVNSSIEVGCVLRRISEWSKIAWELIINKEQRREVLMAKESVFENELMKSIKREIVSIEVDAHFLRRPSI